MMHRTLTAAALIALAAAGGCARHYRIVDPATGRIFYSEHIDESRDGSVHFRDVRTFQEVTLQNAHVDRIPVDEFERYTRPH